MITNCNIIEDLITFSVCESPKSDILHVRSSVNKTFRVAKSPWIMFSEDKYSIPLAIYNHLKLLSDYNAYILVLLDDTMQ